MDFNKVRVVTVPFYYRTTKLTENRFIN